MRILNAHESSSSVGTVTVEAAGQRTEDMGSTAARVEIFPFATVMDWLCDPGSRLSNRQGFLPQRAILQTCLHLAQKLRNTDAVVHSGSCEIRLNLLTYLLHGAESFLRS